MDQEKTFWDDLGIQKLISNHSSSVLFTVPLQFSELWNNAQAVKIANQRIYFWILNSLYSSCSLVEACQVLQNNCYLFYLFGAQNQEIIRNWIMDLKNGSSVWFIMNFQKQILLAHWQGAIFSSNNRCFSRVLVP